ncbi:MAG: DNA methylase, partial [Chloroflexi bacterium]|nr:DNA methylase [Chloroflexota bacterium]
MTVVAAWFGSKATSGLCQAIIAALPPHDVYVEPFLGGGAIMKRKPASMRSIGIDLDRRAIESFRCDYPVELHHGCGLRFLEEFRFQGRELVYCDPPHVQSTRRSMRRYRHDFDDAAHVALLTLVKSLDCQVLISGYPSGLYDEHLSGWGSFSLQVNNQSCIVTEQVWFNFEPDRVHWASLAGRDFTHRQIVK